MLFIFYRVLLPKHVFDAASETDVISNAERYLQRYPHLLFVKIEDDFAICERK